MIRDEVMSHYARLLKFAQRLTKNTEAANDLLHDTVIRALEQEHHYQQGSNLFSWMSKIMFNLFVIRYRRAKKFETQYDPEPYIAAAQIAPSQETTCDFNTTLSRIGKLPEHQRNALIGHVQGEAYNEIATRLGIPVGTVRSRIHRARKNLSLFDQTTQ